MLFLCKTLEAQCTAGLKWVLTTPIWGRHKTCCLSRYNFCPQRMKQREHGEKNENCEHSANKRGKPGKNGKESNEMSFWIKIQVQRSKSAFLLYIIFYMCIRICKIIYIFFFKFIFYNLLILHFPKVVMNYWDTNVSI